MLIASRKRAVHPKWLACLLAPAAEYSVQKSVLNVALVARLTSACNPSGDYL